MHWQRVKFAFIRDNLYVYIFWCEEIIILSNIFFIMLNLRCHLPKHWQLATRGFAWLCCAPLHTKPTPFLFTCTQAVTQSTVCTIPHGYVELWTLHSIHETHWFVFKPLKWGSMTTFYQGNYNSFKWLYLDSKLCMAFLISAVNNAILGSIQRFWSGARGESGHCFSLAKTR